MRARRIGGLLALMAASLWLPAAEARSQETTAPAAEEAADFARREAFAALHGPQKIFLESIDADGILRRLLSNSVWSALTSRQQSLLRTAVREHFAQALAPASKAPGEVAWARVAESGEGPILVDLGMRYESSILKTRWTVRRTPRGWTIEDILLVDPGLSLATEVGRLLGPDPVRRRNSGREARAKVLPRLIGLAAIAALVAVVARRLPRERRPLLWLTASVPAVLFLVDGSLALHRTLSEPYALAPAPPPQPWRHLEKRALEAQGAGRADEARDAWLRAVDAGAPAAPVFYQMGLQARARGDAEKALADFERARAEKPSAPGALRELAAIRLSRGELGEARSLLEAYRAEAGPDPETLATLAVVLTNLGDTAAAVRTIEKARSMVPDVWRRAELEAQIHGRSGNASATVAALEPLESEGRLDRSALRADPAYLPIATDPVWVAFLAEPSSASTRPPTRPPSASPQQ
ncbi:MAG: tetratricopeptide repeat protein [Thermoanaerobaculia bacterium]